TFGRGFVLIILPNYAVIPKALKIADIVWIWEVFPAFEASHYNSLIFREQLNTHSYLLASI
ncbi:MAG: hypothetical protein WBV16_14995, partial [Desulfobaccales bacterium]